MSEVKITRYKCDECGKVYKTEAGELACMNEHKADDKITAVGREVVVDIGGPGAPSMMGGPCFGHDAEYVIGKVIALRRTDEGPEAMVELPNGEREWHGAWVLRQWAQEKKAAEYRVEHREEIEAAERNASQCSVIMAYPNRIGVTWNC